MILMNEDLSTLMSHNLVLTFSKQHMAIDLHEPPVNITDKPRTPLYNILMIISFK